MSERSISAAPKVRKAWKTSGMSTVRASIVASRRWRAAAMIVSWNRRFASWIRRTPFDRVDVDGAPDLAERVGGGDQLAELGLGRPFRRHLDGIGLEADAQAVEVDDLGGRQRAHHGATVAFADDQTLGFEHAQRLAHRRARQAELLGDALLDQPLAGQVAVLDDGGAHLLVGALGADGVGGLHPTAPSERSDAISSQPIPSSSRSTSSVCSPERRDRRGGSCPAFP